MLDSSHPGPINLGNPIETTIKDLAAMVIKMTHSSSGVVYSPKPVDDPSVRKPDIQAASEFLNWVPKISLEIGLAETISWQSACKLAIASEAKGQGRARE
jgi:dTDP-glucose 4,6-dehydratase